MTSCDVPKQQDCYPKKIREDLLLKPHPCIPLKVCSSSTGEVGVWVSRCPGDPPPHKSLCELYQKESKTSNVAGMASHLVSRTICIHSITIFTKKHLNILYIIIFCSIALFLTAQVYLFYTHAIFFFVAYLYLFHVFACRNLLISFSLNLTDK